MRIRYSNVQVLNQPVPHSFLLLLLHLFLLLLHSCTHHEINPDRQTRQPNVNRIFSQRYIWDQFIEQGTLTFKKPELSNPIKWHQSFDPVSFYFILLYLKWCKPNCLNITTNTVPPFPIPKHLGVISKANFIATFYRRLHLAIIFKTNFTAVYRGGVLQ